MSTTLGPFSCLWSDSADAIQGTLPSRPVRAALPGGLDVDVCIVGAGFTGLWTSWFLKTQDPSIRVAVIEQRQVGFGASGRNGGWVQTALPSSIAEIASSHSVSAARAVHNAMVESVAAIGSFAGEHAPGSHFTQAGQLHVATNSAQLARLNRWVTDHHRFGMSETDYRGLSIAEIAGKIRVAGVVGGYFTPHCAVVNPRPLIDALAALCESLGVHIFENTRAEEITPGRVRTRQGDVKCTVVVRATEGYTANFRRDHRELMPIFSLMIATEPLAQDVWDEIGWAERFAFSDGRNLIIYAQRTADDRIAFGGRGAPYRFGSNTHDRFADNIGAHMILRKELVRLFPVLADTAITHRWGGILGVSRDWNASVGFDRRSGFAWAGGYVGDGLTATHLAGQTVADLIFRHDTERTTLPWVGHRSRKWEVEPFRTLGVRAISALAASIDEAESRGRHARIRSKVFDLML